MAKVGSVQRNNKRAKLAKTYENKRRELKAKIYDKNLSLEERFACSIAIAKLPRNSAKIRIKNRCGLTGRPRGYLRKFGLSRIMVRKLAGVGALPGVVKASW